jgi:DNA mismatch repair ATPase MutS
LFDELFNGTSADYQLALAWAFLEECSKHELRVIVSTHNRDLEFFSDPEGYDHVQGSFSRPAEEVKHKGARGAKTVSIGENRKLKPGSERDSKAFVIAREVLSPDYVHVVDRAEAILAHLRSARSHANSQ